MTPMLKCTLCGAIKQRLTASMLSGTMECVCETCCAAQRAMFQPVCDFCTGGPVAWRYPTESYIAPLTEKDRAAIPQEIILTSNEDWAACEACHALIQMDQWEVLARRSLDSYVAGEGPGCDDRAGILHALKLLHGKFREYRTGQAFRQEGFIDEPAEEGSTDEQTTT